MSPLAAWRQGIGSPPANPSPYAPSIATVKLNPDKLRDIIGPGGKMIRAIQSESGTNIEVEDDGTIRITGAKPEGRDKARAMRFTTLEVICAALDCQPGDLIEYRPAEDPAAPGDTADPARLPPTHQPQEQP